MNGRQCQGVTKRGKRCRRWAKTGSDFCGLHDGSGAAPGAPSGNRNAAQHGFYSGIFTDDEIADLAAAASAEGLADEIALLRVRLRRAALDDGVELDIIGRACGRLTQMLKAQRVLTGEAMDQFETALAEVLEGLTEELGLALE